MKHLIGIKDLSEKEILSILELGETFREKLINDRNNIPQILKDKVIANLFLNLQLEQE